MKAENEMRKLQDDVQDASKEGKEDDVVLGMKRSTFCPTS